MSGVWPGLGLGQELRVVARRCIAPADGRSTNHRTYVRAISGRNRRCARRSVRGGSSDRMLLGAGFAVVVGEFWGESARRGCNGRRRPVTARVRGGALSAWAQPLRTGCARLPGQAHLRTADRRLGRRSVEAPDRIVLYSGDLESSAVRMNPAPPRIAECVPSARLEAPPLTVASGPLALFSRPPRIAAASPPADGQAQMDLRSSIDAYGCPPGSPA